MVFTLIGPYSYGIRCLPVLDVSFINPFIDTFKKMTMVSCASGCIEQLYHSFVGEKYDHGTKLFGRQFISLDNESL